MFCILQNAKSKRESIGVELYGFQQNLAKLQLSLEQTHQNYQMINKMRTQASGRAWAVFWGSWKVCHGMFAGLCQYAGGTAAIADGEHASICVHTCRQRNSFSSYGKHWQTVKTKHEQTGRRLRHIRWSWTG